MDVNILDLAKRVRRGVKLLDRKVPNWRTVMRRHVDQYDFADGDHCVLGTLEHFCGRLRVQRGKIQKSLSMITGDNGFVRASIALGLSRNETGSILRSAEEHGFEAPGSVSEERPVLSDLWRAEFER